LFLSLICYTLAQQATNTTDFVPAGGEVQPEQRPPGGSYGVASVPPPGAKFEGQPVVANKAAIGQLKQNEIGVFFIGNKPNWAQNIPSEQLQSGFVSDGNEIATKNQSCFDGLETGNEVCDYGKDTCCNVNTDCTSWLTDGSSCRFPEDASNAVKKTKYNLLCFTDVCREITEDPYYEYEEDQTKCVRETIPALKTSEKFKKGVSKGVKIDAGKECFSKVTSSRKLDTRGSKKKKNKHGKKGKIC
jgi:hypothetical protein